MCVYQFLRYIMESVHCVDCGLWTCNFLNFGLKNTHDADTEVRTRVESTSEQRIDLIDTMECRAESHEVTELNQITEQVEIKEDSADDKS